MAKSLAAGGSSWKSRIMAILFGYAMGVLIDLGINYIFTQYVYPMTDVKDGSGAYVEPLGRHTLFIKDFTIFPDQFVSVGGVTTYYMYFDDLILLISTAAMLLTRKVWFVLGYFLGWYSSSYLNFYTLLGLPIGPRDVKPA